MPDQYYAEIVGGVQIDPGRGSAWVRLCFPLAPDVPPADLPTWVLGWRILLLPSEAEQLALALLGAIRVRELPP